MQGASPRKPATRSHSRSVGASAALALAAALCAGVLFLVGGDDGRLPATATAAASSAAVEHPGELAKRDAARARIDTVRPSDALARPLRGKVTSRFGDPRGGRSHDGIDIPMPADTPIRAAANGTVILRESEAGYGKYTCVAHRSITTCYGHQSRFGTTRGARVRRGEVIGYVGNTGNSPAVHLHFEVRRGTRPWGPALNPAKFLPGSR